MSQFNQDQIKPNQGGALFKTSSYAVPLSQSKISNSDGEVRIMPRMEADFTTVDAGFPVHPTGRYRLKLLSVKPFVRESKADADGNTKLQYGVRYVPQILGKYDEEGELDSSDTWAGKSVSVNTLWLHSVGGWKFAKPFLMAACGFNVRNQENEANEELFQVNTWHVDGEVGAQAENIEYGSGFDLPVDRIVECTMVKTEDYNAETGETFEGQEFKGWTPVEA